MFASVPQLLRLLTLVDTKKYSTVAYTWQRSSHIVGLQGGGCESAGGAR